MKKLKALQLFCLHLSSGMCIALCHSCFFSHTRFFPNPEWFFQIGSLSILQLLSAKLCLFLDSVLASITWTVTFHTTVRLCGLSIHGTTIVPSHRVEVGYDFPALLGLDLRTEPTLFLFASSSLSAGWGLKNVG